MDTKEKLLIPRADFPEQAGVDSAVVADYLKEAVKRDIELHSLMVIRGGRVAFECWREPYASDVPHTLYSVSKTVTGTAIGIAVGEGLLSLETRFLDIFPEYAPEKRDEWLEKVTVGHLVTMTAGKEVSYLVDRKKDWIQLFVDGKWLFEPGKGWKYINDNIYLLCAILTRVSGMSVREYMKTRFFEPLGIERDIMWETDQNGVEAGGWGCFLTTEEIAKMMLCYKNGGQLFGRQIIPESWARAAGQPLVYQQGEPGKTDSDTGYGYVLWRNSVENSYRADGMFSQFGIVFDDYDAICIFTSSEIDEQKSRDCIWDFFPKAFINPQEKKPEAASEKIGLPPLPLLEKKERSPIEKGIEGRTIHFRKKLILNAAGYPLSVLPLAVVYMSAEKAGNIDDLSFSFYEDTCEMSWREGKEKNTVVCGMDGKNRISQIRLGGLNFNAVSSAAWENENTLSVWVRARESICERRLQFTFSGSRVKIKPSSMPELKSLANNLAGGIENEISGKLLVKILQFFMMNCYGIVEPIHRGKFKK